MKNLTLSVLLIALSSCNSGGGSLGSTIGNITNPTSPDMPAVINSIPLNQLFKSDTCFVENGNQSSRRYFTKISATELQLEADLFSQPDCEVGPSPIVVLAANKVIFTITGSSASLAVGFTNITTRQEYYGLMPLDEGFRLSMEANLTVNGPSVIGEYHNMSGEPNQPVNGTLMNADIKYVGGLLTFDGATFQ